MSSPLVNSMLNPYLKRFYKSLSAFVALLLSVGCLAKPQHPNVLWIMVEDMNPWMEMYGDSTVSTPTLSKLAAEGVRFDNAIMPAPICSPARSAMVTGSMQTTIGAHNHASARSPNAPIYLPEGYLTVPEVFRTAGYQTFNIGKDDYNFTYNRDDLYSLNIISDKHKKAYAKSRRKMKKGSEFDWIKAVGDKPFFGQIQLQGGKNLNKPIQSIDPNTMKVPPYYPDHPAFRKEWAQHYERIVLTDREVGEILNKLEKAGLKDNTIVFFFTDHGMRLNRHKQFLYEGGLKVPFIAHWPAGAEQLRAQGAVRKDLVSGIDLGPASLALAGIEVPDYMEGQAIFAQDYRAKDHVIAARDRGDFTFERMRAVRSDRFKYIRNFRPELPYMQPNYRDSHDYTLAYKALYWARKLTPEQEAFAALRKPVEELYDLQADPHELNNLALDPNYSSTLEWHRNKLETWIKATDDKGQYPEPVEAVKAVMDRWPDCYSAECEQVRASLKEQ